MKSLRATLIFSFSLCAVAAIAWAEQSGNVFSITQPIEHDVYAAHREVHVQSTVGGDLVTAGRKVTIAGAVTGDVIAAGQSIEIKSEVGDDVRAAGQHVRIEAPVSGHVVAAGQSVTINSQVSDWAWLSGNTVAVLGNVGSDLKIQANKITIDADVNGNVELSGDEFSLGPNAVVRGDLTWRSNNDADINSAAKIEGRFVQESPPGLVEELSSADAYSLPLNTIVAVAVLFLLFPNVMSANADRVATRPGIAFLLGLAILAGMPVLAISLFFTGIGTWLGFAVLLVYLGLLLFGVLTGLFAVSDWVLRKFQEHPVLWQSLVAILVTVIGVGLITKIPRFGFFFVFAIMLIGVGTLCWNSWATLRGFGRHSDQLN